MKSTFKPENVIAILDENTASCAKVYCVLIKELSKKRKPTESVPTLKQIAQQYKLQERSIKKALSYLIPRGFINYEDIPAYWEIEHKGKITKDVQNVINIVTEAAINAEEPESVNDDVFVKVKAVNSVTAIKKVYCLLPFIISNSYLSNEIVDKLDKDWLSRPLDKTRYKEQLKLNREFKKKQQELQQEKITVQAKKPDGNVVEVDAERIEIPIPEATKQRFSNKQTKIFQQKKQNLNRRYTVY